MTPNLYKEAGRFVERKLFGWTIDIVCNKDPKHPKIKKWKESLKVVGKKNLSVRRTGFGRLEGLASTWRCRFLLPLYGGMAELMDNTHRYCKNYGVFSLSSRFLVERRLEKIRLTNISDGVSFQIQERAWEFSFSPSLNLTDTCLALAISVLMSAPNSSNAFLAEDRLTKRSAISSEDFSCDRWSSSSKRLLSNLIVVETVFHNMN